jgi:hypothetical protein
VRTPRGQDGESAQPAVPAPAQATLW